MRLGLSVCLLALCLVCPSASAEDKSGYALHEWGVFTIPRGDAWAQRDMRAEWASFPDFFHGLYPKRKLPYRGGVRKPVIFLHAEKSQQLSLQIRFAEGRPLVWWPPARCSGSRDSLRFDLTLHSSKYQVRTDLSAPVVKQPPVVTHDHWVARLRKVGATPVFASNGHSSEGGMDLIETDRFVYYDGLMKAPKAPDVTRQDGGVMLISESNHAWLDVLIIDRRPDSEVFISNWLPRIEKGNQRTNVALSPADPAGVAELAPSLTKRLVKAGLNEGEAASLVDVWREGLFDVGGLTVLYRIEQATYDRWLPLTATPMPRETVRVGLVIHEHLEPELEMRVKALIKQLGSEKHKEREVASEALATIGGAALKWLHQAAKSNDLEVASRCKQIIESIDALPGLGVVPPLATSP